MKRRIASLLTICVLVLRLGMVLPGMATESTFADVPTDHWAYRDIEGMASRKVVNGVGDGRFNPDGKVTCADFSTMLVRLFFADELAKHIDQPKSYWWQPYTDTLMELGAFDYTDISGSYHKKGKKWDSNVVEAPLNRYKMAQIMDNVMELKGAIFPSWEKEAEMKKEIADLSSFPISNRNAVVTMYTMGCLQGMDSAGNFRGEEQMNRAQACAVLTRMVDKLENQSPDDVPDLSFDWLEPELVLEVGTAYASSSVYIPRGAKIETVSSDPNVVKTKGGGLNAVSPGVAHVTYTASFWHKSAQKTVTVIVVGKVGSDSNIQTLREQMLTLINRERTAEGMGPLVLDDRLCQAAQARAEELVQSYSHTRPDGRSCFTAMTEAGVNYRFSGENIAAGQQSVVEAMADWMNSPGHRANILNNSYGRVGIGFTYADGGYRAYWAQMFAD